MDKKIKYRITNIDELAKKLKKGTGLIRRAGECLKRN